jgi:hypothetical protein
MTIDNPRFHVGRKGNFAPFTRKIIDLACLSADNHN